MSHIPELNIFLGFGFLAVALFLVQAVHDFRLAYHAINYADQKAQTLLLAAIASAKQE